MSKETAVDYLVDAIRNHIEKGTLNAVTISELKMAVKVVEREQIRDSYIAGFNQRDEVDKGLFFNPLAVTYCEKVFSQWYNETYK
jgi:hypothetical protein